ncbi:MAG: hypothetical protein WD535_03325, partial [Thermaerobacterales bacterium]
HPTEKQVFFFGSTGGGVWKTNDSGISWHNLSDGYFKRASVGAIALAGSDPNVIYVGMGECNIRGNVSHGDGVYKSTDGGRTWQHKGLAATQNIARVRVHPNDPNIVYVAALGHVWGPNGERGVFRSHDGGDTWTKVLFRSEQAGAIDLTMDAQNPRILYASFWEVYRKPWYLHSGGEGSSIYKTIDGGETWTELTGRPGLPERVKGRIGVAVSPVRPDRIWAMVEAHDGGMFRSDDGGESWQRVNSDNSLRQRAWYYSHVHADSTDADRVYMLNARAWRSDDAGEHFKVLTLPHGDFHDLWIDPEDNQRMICGTDSGACVSHNGGRSWSSLHSQPTSEFYHVTTDTKFPYRLYGAPQDNPTISVPSRSPRTQPDRAGDEQGPILQNEWYTEVGGGESGHVAVRPDDPDIIFAGMHNGYITRMDRRTRQARNIQVWPEIGGGVGAKDLKYRFQWTYPIIISPHDSKHVYVGGNHVFRTTNDGHSWDCLSPDLTRNDKSKQISSGGPITKENMSIEYYCTIFALDESPVQQGVLWAGSDDGLIHVSVDHGETWTNVTPPDLPEALISIIDASPHDAGTAYVAANRYKHDDFAPYLYKTNDFGKTWRLITAGIPADQFTRVIREDSVRKGLLFAGTEAGIYVSFDDGESWRSLQSNLPIVPIHDFVIKDEDLVIATHGRSFWILDDISPLREYNDDLLDQPAALFSPRPTVRSKTFNEMGTEIERSGGRPMEPDTMQYVRTHGINTPYFVAKRRDGSIYQKFTDAGENIPEGVIVYYYASPAAAGETVTLTIMENDGTVIREFSTSPPPAGRENIHYSSPALLKVLPGVNRFVWDMRHPGPVLLGSGKSPANSVNCPLVSPGSYRVKLTVGNDDWEHPFEIIKHPLIDTTSEEFTEQASLTLGIRDRLTDTRRMVNDIRAVSEELNSCISRLSEVAGGDDLIEEANSLLSDLGNIEEALTQPKTKQADPDETPFPLKLDNQFSHLMGVVTSADARPTQQSQEMFSELSCRVDAWQEELAGMLQDRLAPLEQKLRDSGAPLLTPIPTTQQE